MCFAEFHSFSELTEGGFAMINFLWSVFIFIWEETCTCHCVPGRSQGDYPWELVLSTLWVSGVKHRSSGPHQVPLPIRTSCKPLEWLKFYVFSLTHSRGLVGHHFPCVCEDIYVERRPLSAIWLAEGISLSSQSQASEKAKDCPLFLTWVFYLLLWHQNSQRVACYSHSFHLSLLFPFLVLGI